ncbi:SMP-30/gluconolactonase/LRE family protein [Streptomyces sp. NPDC048362]|uniref:SMP-30/gluconolactonase/LRE family protein n=1 Tax=Streptomyces sp. NPDC048362 TaxID=3365539 RepID=UPI003717B59E
MAILPQAAVAFTSAVALTGVCSGAVFAHSSSSLHKPVYAFVVNSDTPTGQHGSLAMVDTASNQTVKVFKDGLGENPESVAVSPNGETAYVASFGDVTHAQVPQIVTALNAETGKILATVQVGLQPVQVVLSPDSKHLYVVNSGTVPDPGSIQVIDTTTLTVTATFSGIHNPAGIALSHNGRRAYVTDQSGNSVRVIDTSDGSIINTITLGDADVQPTGIVLSSDGRRAYVAENAAGAVAVIDTNADKVVGNAIRLPGFGMPYGLALTPDNKHLYVTEASSDEVAVVDTATATAKPNTITVGRNPTSVAITPDGESAYVTSASDDSKGVSVINTHTDTVSASLNTGSSPFGIAITH